MCIHYNYLDLSYQCLLVNDWEVNPCQSLSLNTFFRWRPRRNNVSILARGVLCCSCCFCQQYIGNTGLNWGSQLAPDDGSASCILIGRCVSVLICYWLVQTASDHRPGRFRNFPSVSGLSVFVLQTLITPIGGRLGVFSFGYRVTELRLTVPAQV